MAESELEQITYLRRKKPPTLKQFLVRKSVAMAASGAKGETGVTTGPHGAVIPKSAVKIKEALAGLKDSESIAQSHPEWVEEWRESYGTA
jgi:hypothetical protein